MQETSLYYDTIGELSSLLFSSASNSTSSSCSNHQLVDEIPTEFLVPQSIRPTLSFDAASSSGDDPLPLFDLAHAAADHHSACKQLTEMCEEWGFVQVINHGVPSHIIREMASFGHGFFSLPTEHKKRGAISYLSGYDAKPVTIKGLGTPWVEGLTLMLSPESNIEAFEAKMWPNEEHTDPDLRRTVQQLDAALEKLEITLLRLLAEGLGLESTFFSQHFEKLYNKQKSTVVRLNYYPPCPDPSKVLGMFPHTDGGTLTVLYQDQISGFQVQAKDGRTWHPVHHRQDGLLVLLGDTLQGWSNGRFPAMLHRVVLNDKIPRLSFLHAINPDANLLIQPVGHPQRYKAFTCKEFIKYKMDRFNQYIDHTQKPIDAYAALDRVTT